ncbi:MAG: hypothetical protein ACI8WT_003304 [Clostridium sp.]|jgi:hypothetical protein
MWSRELLKNKAKEVLRVSYWKAFLVSLIVAFIGGRDNNSINLNWNSGNHTSLHGFTPFSKNITVLFPFLLSITIGLVIIIFLFALTFRIFLGYTIEVGGKRYFVQSAQGNIDLNYIGYGFGNGKYSDIIITMLWRDILNFLWFLLLIIPGIIKSYAYRMVPYILSDNPSIGRDRAIELSTKMTDGQKMDMWVLDLSFIGWYILGTLLLLVGVLFVMPYENATKSELYLVLRQNALDQGLCSYKELKLSHLERVLE